MIRQRILTRPVLGAARSGPHGGSIYYLAYAGHHVDLANEETLWATIAFIIVISTLVHGITAGIAVEKVTGEPPPQASP